jgi:hypothetical protein
VETCWDELGDEPRLLESCEVFLSVPGRSNEETACLDVPACSSSCSSTASVSFVSETPSTSFEVVYILSNLKVAGVFCSRNVAWFDVLGVFFETGVAVGVDNVAVE